MISNGTGCFLGEKGGSVGFDGRILGTTKKTQDNMFNT